MLDEIEYLDEELTQKTFNIQEMWTNKCQSFTMVLLYGLWNSKYIGVKWTTGTLYLEQRLMY